MAGQSAGDDWFQSGSDALARRVINDNISGRISGLPDIIDSDVGSAVEDLGLGNRDRWAGTSGDIVFLFGDFVSITGQSVGDYVDELARSILSNVDGVLNALGVSHSLHEDADYMMDHGLG